MQLTCRGAEAVHRRCARVEVASSVPTRRRRVHAGVMTIEGVGGGARWRHVSADRWRVHRRREVLGSMPRAAEERLLRGHVHSRQ